MHPTSFQLPNIPLLLPPPPLLLATLPHLYPFDLIFAGFKMPSCGLKKKEEQGKQGKEIYIYSRDIEGVYKGLDKLHIDERMNE